MLAFFGGLITNSVKTQVIALGTGFAVSAIKSLMEEDDPDVKDCEKVFADPMSVMIHLALAAHKDSLFQKKCPGMRSEIRLSIAKDQINSSMRLDLLSGCHQTITRVTKGEGREDLDLLRPILLKFFEWYSTQNPDVYFICRCAKYGLRALQNTYTDPNELAPQATYVQLESYVDLIKAMLSKKQSSREKKLSEPVNQKCFPNKDKLFTGSETFDEFMSKRLEIVWTAQKTAYVARELHILNQMNSEINQKELLEGYQEIDFWKLMGRINLLEGWMDKELSELPKIWQTAQEIAERNSKDPPTAEESRVPASERVVRRFSSESSSATSLSRRASAGAPPQISPCISPLVSPSITASSPSSLSLASLSSSGFSLQSACSSIEPIIQEEHDEPTVYLGQEYEDLEILETLTSNSFAQKTVTISHSVIKDCERVPFDPMNLMIQVAIAGIKDTIFKKKHPGVKSEIRLSISQTGIESSVGGGVKNKFFQSTSRMVYGESKRDIDLLRPILIKFFEWYSIQKIDVRTICEYAENGFRAIQETYIEPNELAPNGVYVQLESYINIIEAMLSDDRQTGTLKMAEPLNQKCFPGKESLFSGEQTFDQFMRLKLQLGWTSEKLSGVVKSLNSIKEKIVGLNAQLPFQEHGKRELRDCVKAVKNLEQELPYLPQFKS